MICWYGDVIDLWCTMVMLQQSRLVHGALLLYECSRQSVSVWSSTSAQFSTDIGQQLLINKRARARVSAWTHSPTQETWLRNLDQDYQEDHQGSGLVEFVSEEEELQQRRVAHLPIDINITTFYLFWVTNWELEYHQGNTVQQKCDNILIKSTWRRSYSI